MSYPEGDTGARSLVPVAPRIYERSGPFVDVAALLAEGLPEPPAPTICRRDDGVGLFYEGQVNTVFGDPESGKTWLAYGAVVETLIDGGRALIIDADHNGGQQVLWRLLALGAPLKLLADPALFRLAEPEDRSDLLTAVQQGAAWCPTVAVVDSVGEVLPILGKSSNSPDDYTDAHRLVLRPLALAGAAVVQVDHLPKSVDSRRQGPTGTAAKGRAVGGVSLRVTVREPFTPGRGGVAVLTIWKDRPGGLRAHAPMAQGVEPTAGVFRLSPEGDGLRWAVAKGEAQDALTAAEVSGRAAYTPTEGDLAVLDALPYENRKSVRAVKEATRWGSDKATAALRVWKQERDQERSRNVGTSVPAYVPRSLDPDSEERGNTSAPMGCPS